MIRGRIGFELPKTIIFSTFNLVTISRDLIKAKSLSRGGTDLSVGFAANKRLSIMATLTTKLTFPTHTLDKK